MSISPGQQYILDFSDLTQTRTWTERDELVRKMELLHGKLDPASKEAVILGFALARICDDLGEVDRSFELLVEANRHHKSGKTDTIEDARATVAGLRQLFSTQSIEPLDRQDEISPIFIVGMPRSGTTLVEQILASHSRVHGGGELRLMGQWCFGFLRLYAGDTGNIRLDNYLSQLREHYLTGLQAITSKSVVTDKMPLNFLWLGFIVAALPGARIIHTKRDPMATCWSIYKTAFAGTSNAYSCDLGEIGEFYSLYHSLMTFWRERFGDVIYDLDYERLTRVQEDETRCLLAFCGLDWEWACMEFHRNQREVRTVSWAQVRRPMYQGSSESWKAYDKYLDPLRDALHEDILA